MKYVARILLFIGTLLPIAKLFSQDLPVEKRWVPSDWGMNLDDFNKKDLADSVARLELEGYIFPLSIDIGFSENLRSYEDLIIRPEHINTGIYDFLWIKIHSSFKEAYPGEFRYKTKGLSIIYEERFFPELVYEDSLLEGSSFSPLLLKIPFHQVLEKGLEGSFRLVFHELYRVDSKNRTFLRDRDHSNSLNFNLFFMDSDPYSGREFGFPRIVLLVDGEIYHEGDFISPNSEVFVSLLPSPRFVESYPNEQNYQIQGIKIFERGHPFLEERLISTETSGWNKSPKIRIPLDSLPVISGNYFLEVGNVSRKDPSGKVYLQKRYGSWERIEFRKNAPH